MAPFWIKWFKPLLLLLAAQVNSSPSGVPVLNYPANPSFIQAHGQLFPLPSSPTTYTTQTLGLPVLTSQSSFFVKSLPPFASTPVVPFSPPATPLLPLPTAPATPLFPLPTASATPVGPLPSAPSTPFVPFPPSSVPLPSPPLVPPTRSAPVPTLLIYSDGSVVPLSDTHYKFPPIIEGFINRVQNYFSNYAQIDPNSVPFPIKFQQKPSNLADNSSTAAITTTTTTTTTAKSFGPAINLRLVAAPNSQQQHQPAVGFARTSTVPTSTGRTAKLVEVFRPDGQLSGSLVQSTDDNQIPLAIATATATVNFDGSDPSRPSTDPNPPNRPAQPPNRPAQPPNRPAQPPSRPSRPEKPRPNPRPDPPQGYRYDRPQLRPQEYDIPPKPEAFRSRGPF